MDGGGIRSFTTFSRLKVFSSGFALKRNLALRDLIKYLYRELQINIIPLRASSQTFISTHPFSYGNFVPLSKASNPCLEIRTNKEPDKSLEVRNWEIAELFEDLATILTKNGFYHCTVRLPTPCELESIYSSHNRPAEWVEEDGNIFASLENGQEYLPFHIVISYKEFF